MAMAGKQEMRPSQARVNPAAFRWWVDLTKGKYLSMAKTGLPTAADGGIAVEDISADVGGEDRARLAGTFLRTK